MLVLSRKTNERIIITLGIHTIEVQVLKVDGQKVRLGIDAPAEVAVHREEVWKRQAEFAAPSVPVLPTDAWINTESTG